MSVQYQLVMFNLKYHQNGQLIIWCSLLLTMHQQFLIDLYNIPQFTSQGWEKEPHENLVTLVGD